MNKEIDVGRQIIRQPDGKLAVFSSVVDAFIITDATAEEIIEEFATEAAEDCRRDARRACDAVISGNAASIYFQFAMTFEEAKALEEETTAANEQGEA